MAKGKYQKWITAEGLARIEQWARDKLTDEAIAKNMGITASTFYAWNKKYSDISEAIKRGREPVVENVENALLKRAEGFRDVERTYERVRNPETGEFEMMLTKEVERVYPPDVGAIAFYLKNKDPENWKDRKDLDVNSISISQTKMDGILEQLKGGKK